MFTIQTLIAIAVAVGVAVAWTIALVVAGTVGQRDQARAARAPRNVTTPGQADDTQELVLR
jgi:putative effector of murein hydrolase